MLSPNSQPVDLARLSTNPASAKERLWTDSAMLSTTSLAFRGEAVHPLSSLLPSAVLLGVTMDIAAATLKTYL